MFKNFRKNLGNKVVEIKNLYGYGLNESFSTFSKSFNGLFVDREFFDEDFFEEFEETLIGLDIVPMLAMIIREQLEKKIFNQRVSTSDFKEAMKEVINNVVDLDINNELVFDNSKLNVLLVMGINGVGKTTTISKLMHKYKVDYNLEVVAADTFRAGAIEQLNQWAQREDVPITKTHEGHAPSAVVYDGMQSAADNDRDLLIVDTAGRLHNQDNLMEELSKISKVIYKYDKKEVNLKKVLVLDGTAGKNTIMQAKKFNEITDIDGIIITKMDTNSKVGIIINIAYELKVPVFYVTNGEQVDKIQEFDYDTYLDLLLGE